MAAIHKAKEELREAVALRKEITQQQELKERMADELQKRLDDVRKFQAAKSRQVSVKHAIRKNAVDKPCKFSMLCCCMCVKLFV
jgi:hypothetical protein